MLNHKLLKLVEIGPPGLSQEIKLDHFTELAILTINDYYRINCNSDINRLHLTTINPQIEIFDYNMEKYIDNINAFIKYCIKIKKYLSNVTFNFMIDECCNLQKMISRCNIKIRDYDSDEES